MITASELGRLEGKRIVQIHYDPDGGVVEITVQDVHDEYGNEVDRTLRIIGPPTSDDGTTQVSIW